MRYAKGHGTGNDFVVLPDLADAIDLCPDLVRRLCDRHTGIGGDGVLRVVRAAAGQDAAPWFMDYRNADGSVAEMCGNGVRVFARFLIDAGLATGPEIAVATRAGTRLVRREDSGEFTVGMGPVTIGGTSSAVIGGRGHGGLVVSVGNPHLACLVDEPVAGFDLTAPPEVDPAVFPDGANVEVVRVTGARSVQMRVRERGSGETLSCGTGAVAAAAAAAVAAGGNAASSAWTVEVPGGRLTVVPDPAGALLTGPAQIVAEGEISPAWLDGPRTT